MPLRDSIIDMKLVENHVSGEIIGAAIEVHRTLGGPGLLESIYQDSLECELIARGLDVECEKFVPVQYKGKTLRHPMRLDMLVNGLVVVECKATEEHKKVFESQALTYLRLTGLKLALVINFGAKTIREGTHRVANNL